MGSRSPLTTLDISKICRVCMRSDRQPLCHMFDKQFDDNLNLAEMLQMCSKYPVKINDALPSQLCVVCQTTACTAYRFRRECEQSYIRLTFLLNNGRDVVKEVKEIELNELEEKRFSTTTKTVVNAIECEELGQQQQQQTENEILTLIDENTITNVDCDDPEKIETDYEMEFLYETQAIEVENEFGKCEVFEMTEEQVYTVKDEDDEPLAALLEQTTEANEEYDVSETATNTAEGWDSVNALTDSNIRKHKNVKTKQKRKRGRPPHITTETEHCINRNHDDMDDMPPLKSAIKNKMHQCNICKKCFTTKMYLIRHISIHERKRYVCKECSESYLTKDELAAHIKKEGHDKPMLCPECGLRCKTSHILTVHMRRHRGEKPFKCKFCSKGFPRIDDLRVHEKYHTGEKSHFCETCGKGFQRKYNLTLHLRVHTGERPFKCAHCPQAFAQGNDLKAHIRRHTGERFRCEICDAAFLQIYQIRQHKLIDHGIKEDAPTQRVAKFTSPEAQEQQIKRNLLQEMF